MCVCVCMCVSVCVCHGERVCYMRACERARAPVYVYIAIVWAHEYIPY